jgi:tetratricopeptide (TPR) repeat protein
MESNETMIKELQAIRFALYICIILLIVLILQPSFSSVTLLKYFEKYTDKETSQRVSIDVPRVKSAWSIQLIQDTLNRGDLDAVVKISTERIKEFPNDAQPYWYRAKAYVTLGKYEDALSDVNKAELIAPEWREQWTEPLRNVILEALNTQREKKSK